MVNQNAINRSVSKANTNMERVNILASQELRSVIAASAEMTFDEQARFVRTTTPVIIEKYGAVASTVAATHYNEYRGLVSETLELPQYRAIAKPATNFTERISKLLDISIAKTITSGFQEMQAFIINSSTGILSSYNRSTIDYNAQNETTEVVKLQRVASRNACAFCAQMGLVAGNIEGLVYAEDVYAFEPDYHDNCHCTLEVVYSGQQKIRPDYYDSFEKTYNDARKKLIEEGINVERGSTKYGSTLKTEFGKAGRAYRKEAGVAGTLEDIKRFDPTVSLTDSAAREWLYGEADRLSSVINNKGFSALTSVDEDIIDSFFGVNASDLQKYGIEDTFNIKIKRDSITTKNINVYMRQIGGLR